MTTILREEFADQSLTVALQFNVNAHYLIAAAMLRSKLDDAAVGENFGPYSWTQAEWTANTDRTDPLLGDDPYQPEDLRDWRAQVSVFAVMTLKKYGQLRDQLGQAPSALQLYQAQWPGSQAASLAQNLQQACDDTKDAILEAIEHQLPEVPEVDAPQVTDIIEDPKAPVSGDTQPASGDAGNVDLGDPRTAPKPIPANDPVPFASFAPDVETCWPIGTKKPDLRIAYQPASGGVNIAGRDFLATRPAVKGHPRGRFHAGVDLYAAENDPIVACADGTIVDYYNFYSPRPGAPNTLALLVEHPGVVINYGEVKPGSLKGLKKGGSVQMGQIIGAVGTTKMLHFETYKPGAKKNYQWWVGAQQPSQLLNPTKLLLALAAGRAGRPAARQAAVVAMVSPANDKLVGALRGALKLHEIGDRVRTNCFSREREKVEQVLDSCREIWPTAGLR